MTRHALRTMQFAPVGTSRRFASRRWLAICAVICLAATGGAVVWDKARPWSNSLDAAIPAAEHVVPNTPESSGVAVRLLQVSQPAVQALRQLELRGDRSAAEARSLLMHLMAQDAPNDVTIEQIRSRLAGMPQADFIAWLRGALAR
jgi:hypothetical protein